MTMTMKITEYALMSGYMKDNLTRVGTVKHVRFFYPDRVHHEYTYATVFFCLQLTRKQAADILRNARRNLFPNERIERFVHEYSV